MTDFQKVLQESMVERKTVTKQIRLDAVISAAVSQLLAQYKSQGPSEVIQGKGVHRKSGHFNISDTTSAAPEFTRHNEGFILTPGGKKPT